MVKVSVVETRIKRKGRKAVLVLALNCAPDEEWRARFNAARRSTPHTGLNPPSLKGKVLKVPCVGEDLSGQKDYAAHFETIQRGWIAPANGENTQDAA